MSQSTPINLLRRDGNPQSNISNNMDFPSLDNNQFGAPRESDSQLVEDILKEMGESPGLEQQSNINAQAYQYAMDNSQKPSYKSNTQEQNGFYDDGHYSEKLMNQQSQSNNGFLGQIGINLSGDSLKDKIMKNIKYPALVFVISFIISLPEFNRFLFSFFPKLLLESGQVSIGGVLLKSIVAMLLFAIIAFFLLLLFFEISYLFTNLFMNI